MSLRRETPCDFGPCPYDAEQYCSCEYWCGAEEPEDHPEIDIYYDDEEANPDFWYRTTEQPRESN